jgi:hypothetical protein
MLMNSSCTVTSPVAGFTSTSSVEQPGGRLRVPRPLAERRAQARGVADLVVAHETHAPARAGEGGHAVEGVGHDAVARALHHVARLAEAAQREAGGDHEGQPAWIGDERPVAALAGAATAGPARHRIRTGAEVGGRVAGREAHEGRREHCPARVLHGVTKEPATADVSHARVSGWTGASDASACVVAGA